MLSWDKTPALSPMRRCRAWVEIDLAALAHNVRSLKAILKPGTDLMSVVKADAYGHGAVTVAKVALKSGATWLGVATVPEGIELREAGIDAPILVMGAVNEPGEMRAIARWRLQPTIVDFKQALVFSETLAGYWRYTGVEAENTNTGESMVVPVHLMLDTGMSRLGFDWQRPVEFARLVKQLPHLEPVGLYSHFATADELDQTVMRLQHERFERAVVALKKESLLPAKLHLANSAAALIDSALHYDMVRVGLGTYGLYPAPHFCDRIDLQPVLSVKARITHIKQLEAGTGVSYGHRFIANRPMTIAVIGIGYADGIPRMLSNQIEFVVGGQRVPQIGAITMDQTMIDVSALTRDTSDGVQVGDVVTLLGKTNQHSLSADRWAELAQTISWEILCSFKHRLPRIQKGSHQALAIAEYTKGNIEDNVEVKRDA